MNIFTYLSFTDLVRLMLVNTRWMMLLRKILPIHITGISEYFYCNTRRIHHSKSDAREGLPDCIMGLDEYTLYSTYRDEPVYISKHEYSLGTHDQHDQCYEGMEEEEARIYFEKLSKTRLRNLSMAMTMSIISMVTISMISWLSFSRPLSMIMTMISMSMTMSVVSMVAISMVSRISFSRPLAIIMTIISQSMAIISQMVTISMAIISIPRFSSSSSFSSSFPCNYSKETQSNHSKSLHVRDADKLEELARLPM